MAEPGTEVIVESTPNIPPVATGEIPSGKVNEPPDPAVLKAEIEELQKKRDRAREDAMYWRGEKVRSRADYFKPEEKPPVTAPATPAATSEPKQADFSDFNEYTKALVEWKADQIASRKISEWQTTDAQKRANETFQQKVSGLIDRLDTEGPKKYPDFEEVARDPSLPITTVIRDALAECEAPEDVAYYLGKNRATAVQLSRMNPIQAARTIGLIEAEIKAARSNTPPKPKIPGAPPPINPLGSGNIVTKSLEDMNQKEFEAEMEKRTGKRF